VGQLGDVAKDERMRRAFDTIAAAGAVSSLVELNGLFRPAIAELGFGTFAGIELLDPRTNPDFRVLFGEGIESWRTHYVQMQYAADDPVVPECLNRLDPFYWSEITSRGELSEKATSIFHDARRFGLYDGFVAPVHKPGGSIFIVLLAGRDHDSQDPLARASAHLLATYYGQTGRKFYSARQRQRFVDHSLTKRQRECLHWARTGKSSTDIAQILRISSGVVDEHIAGACKRLGVRTRMQAVVAAADRGYLDA
jgi:DNA-binding CsgD family transcriptional regulator